MGRQSTIDHRPFPCEGYNSRFPHTFHRSAMAGHSKWANIKHKKAAADAKRGKIFTRLIKEITVSSRLGGPDPSSNPYLAFAALLMAGIDGIKNRIEPPAPVDKDLYELPPEEHALIPQVPASLPEVLDNLEKDHAFLSEGGVFTEDLIETWIDYKRTNEIAPVNLRVTPYEFYLYFDV